MSDSTGVYLDDVNLEDGTYSTTRPTSLRKETFVASASPSSSYSWGAYICIFFVLAGFIFAIISSVGLGRSTENRHTLNTYIAQWHQVEEERNQHAEIASGTISIGKEERGITLCLSQTYHKVDNEFKPLLSETIQQLRQSEMKQHDYYHLYARLRLIVSSKKEGGGRSLTLLYNLTSTLFAFSSIRLEELEFNTKTNGLGAMRNIVLCSNNPDLDVERCNEESLIENHLFTLRGEQSLPFLIKENKIETQATVDLKENHKNGLRMYNLVFYQDNSNATVVQNKEYRVLTVEPLQC